MIFIKEQKKEAYEKLPREVQFFIMSNDTSDMVIAALGECGLSEEQSDMADSEILWAMYGLQSLLEAITNIAKITNKKPVDFSKLKLELETNIFNYIDNLKSKAMIVSNQEMLTVTGKNKTLEIGKKYSLKDEQIEKLGILVNSLVENPDQTGEVTEMIMARLGVSRILADQIAEDLKARVFTQTTKVTEKTQNTMEPAEIKPKAPEVVPEVMPKVVVEMKKFVPEIPIQIVPPMTIIAKPPINPIKIEPVVIEKKEMMEKAPEIKPEIVPMVEKGEVAHDYTPPAPKVITPQKAPMPAYVPENIPVIKETPIEIPVAEPVQRPVPVPRFVGVKIEEVVPSIADAKLAGVVKSASEVTTPVIVPEITKQKPIAPTAYTVDPYREPLI